MTLRPLLPPDGVTAYRSSATDRRQISLFVAGWLVGSIGALSPAGVTAVTYFDAVARAGFMDRTDADLEHWLAPGALFPAFHVFRALARGETMRQVRIEAASLLACAVRDGRRLTLVVANTSTQAATVHLTLPGLAGGRLALADETTLPALIWNPLWVDTAARSVPGPLEGLELSLPRQAVGFLSGSLVGSDAQRARF